MTDVTLRVLSKNVNNWVVQTPGRQFPGVIIQGDSLKILHSTASELVQRAAACQDEEVHGLAEELESLLRGYLAGYEQALRAANLELPYASSVAPDRKPA